MWIAGQLDVSHESLSNGLWAAAQISANDTGDFMGVESVNAIARKHHTISDMQGERLPGKIDQIQLLTGDGGAQQMTPRIGPRFHFAQPPLCCKLVEHRGQGVILIEEGDFTVSVQIERAIADTYPLNTF